MTGLEFQTAISSLGMTLEESSEYFGVSLSTVYRWHNGESPLPKSVQIVLTNEIAWRGRVDKKATRDRSR